MHSQDLKISHQYLDLKNMPWISSQKEHLFFSFEFFRYSSTGRLAEVKQEEEDGKTSSGTYLTHTANAVFFHPVFTVFSSNPFIICASRLPETCLQLVYLKEEMRERKVGIEIVPKKQITNTVWWNALFCKHTPRGQKKLQSQHNFS